MASPQNREKFASIWVYWLVGITTWSLTWTAFVSFTTTFGEINLIRSEVSMLNEIGELLPMVIVDLELQYAGLNAFSIIARYVVERPFVPAFARLLAYVPRTLSLGSTSCCPSGCAVSILRPMLGKM